MSRIDYQELAAANAFLADVRAVAFNDLCAAFARHAKVAGLDDADTVTLVMLPTY
ncbi:hypothetical protein [Escherichia coli]|uniref:hypothetical protein n=1 Tax=Escherichia coli TaxID=562 RepID=UPI003F66434F